MRAVGRKEGLNHGAFPIELAAVLALVLKGRLLGHSATICKIPDYPSCSYREYGAF